jgi:group I intron endonuclease
MGFIYKITNKVNGKCYIGETTKDDPNKRWNQHKNTISRGVGCPALQLAVNKYGIENFVFSVLIICFDSDRFKYEKEYIQKYNTLGPNGYNMTLGGEGGGFVGKKHTEETKQLIKSKTSGANNPNFGKKKSPEEIKRMSERMKGENNPNFGKKFTKEEKQKRLDRYKNNPETKKRISESLIKYYKENSSDNKRRGASKRTEQYDLHGNLLNTYYSISEAARTINISTMVISRACENPNYTAGGFKWKKFQI